MVVDGEHLKKSNECENAIEEKNSMQEICTKNGHSIQWYKYYNCMEGNRDYILQFTAWDAC